jgi:hypothetical protein
MWEDAPDLVGDTFPGNATHPGMKRLSAELGGMPFKAHAGGWSKGKGADQGALLTQGGQGPEIQHNAPARSPWPADSP